jgi:hypothetical protein
MTQLEKYEAVNQCEFVKELQDLIISFADKSGQIHGRNKIFNAQEMANKVPMVVDGIIPANVLTREYGIRQQALYLAYYND